MIPTSLKKLIGELLLLLVSRIASWGGGHGAGHVRPCGLLHLRALGFNVLRDKATLHPSPPTIRFFFPHFSLFLILLSLLPPSTPSGEAGCRPRGGRQAARGGLELHERDHPRRRGHQEEGGQEMEGRGAY